MGKLQVKKKYAREREVKEKLHKRRERLRAERKLEKLLEELRSSMEPKPTLDTTTPPSSYTHNYQDPNSTTMEGFYES